jgi:hypothetical protein
MNITNEIIQVASHTEMWDHGEIISPQIIRETKTVGLKGQNLTDKDVKRPVTNREHDKNDLYNVDERVGHIGSKTGKWDNGLYVTVFMKTVPVQFLVDSGSTLTLISYKLFMKMCTDKELKLQKSNCQIKDANGKN